MSSTKIQEYNLDPNNGFAKETSIDEVKTLIESLKTEIVAELSNIGCVKSIQRGTAKGTSSSDLITVTLDTAVNPDKCVVILKDSMSVYGTEISSTGGGEIQTVDLSYLYSLTSTQLQFYGNSADRRHDIVSWQLIEFY